MKQFRNTRTRLVPSGRRLLTMALSLPLRPAHARASRFVAEVLFEDRLLSVDAPPPSSRVLALRDTISAMGTRAYRVYPSGPAAEPEDARILYNGDFELTSSPGVRTRSRNKQRNTQTKNTPAGGHDEKRVEKGGRRAAVPLCPRVPSSNWSCAVVERAPPSPIVHLTSHLTEAKCAA